MSHVLRIALCHAVHVGQFLLDHVQSGTPRIADGRVGQAPVIVYGEDVMHVVGLVEEVRLETPQARRVARVHLVILHLLVPDLQLEVRGGRPLRDRTGRVQAAYACANERSAKQFPTRESPYLA